MRSVMKKPSDGFVQEVAQVRRKKASLSALKLTRDEKKGELDPRSVQLLKDVEQTIRDLDRLRFEALDVVEDPEFAVKLMAEAVDLLNKFPEADPDNDSDETEEI